MGGSAFRRYNECGRRGPPKKEGGKTSAYLSFIGVKGEAEGMRKEKGVCIATSLREKKTGEIRRVDAEQAH